MGSVTAGRAVLARAAIPPASTRATAPLRPWPGAHTVSSAVMTPSAALPITVSRGTRTRSAVALGSFLRSMGLPRIVVSADATLPFRSAAVSPANASNGRANTWTLAPASMKS